MYCASVENNGDMRFHATTRDGSFTMAINGNGANPVDTLLAALCGCIGHYVGDFVREQRIPSPGFTVKAEGRQTEDGTMLSAIDLFVELKSIKLENEEKEALLKYVERCKIHNTLKAGCRIRLALV